MQKRSKSLKKSSNPKSSLNRLPCNQCLKRNFAPFDLKKALCRKYSSQQQKYHDLMIFDSIEEKPNPLNSTAFTNPEECLQSYYSSFQRRRNFQKVKEVYKLHTQIPRIFQAEVKQILDKCHYRKRLIQYFRIARVLGVEIESVCLSTFMKSVEKQGQKSEALYQKVVDKISRFEFSQEVQMQLLREMSKENQDLLNLVSTAD